MNTATITSTIPYPLTRAALEAAGIDPNVVPGEDGIHADHIDVFVFNDEGKRIYDRNAEGCKIEEYPYPSRKHRAAIIDAFTAEGGVIA